MSYPTIDADDKRVRLDHTFSQTLNFRMVDGKVRFTASGSPSHSGPGESRMNGVLYLTVDEAREFLTEALALIPERDPIKVNVVTDLAGDRWVETEDGTFRGVWGFDSVAEAYAQGPVEGGLNLLRVAREFGIKDVTEELV